MPDTPEQNSSGPGAPPPTPPSQPPPPPQPPPAGQGSPPSGVSQNRTIMVVLAYLWILGLIPLLVEKDDAEVQWHAKNGLVLTAVEIAAWVLFSVISTLLPFIGCLLAFIPLILGLGLLILRILLIVKGVNGERMRLPVLTDYAERWK